MPSKHGIKQSYQSKKVVKAEINILGKKERMFEHRMALWEMLPIKENFHHVALVVKPIIQKRIVGSKVRSNADFVRSLATSRKIIEQNMANRIIKNNMRIS